MIKTIVFDIGNVLMHFRWNAYIRSLYPESKAKKITQAIWAENCWEALDREIEDEAVIRARMIQQAPMYEEEINYALDHVGECMSKADYAIEWIQTLKQEGYNVLFLSNYSQFLMDACPEVLDFLPYLDGGVFSCDVGTIKPEYDIYGVLLELYNQNPEECVFIDDKEANILAAKEVGMHGIVFTSYEKTSKELADFLSCV